MTVMIRAIKQCHLGVSEFYHSQSFKYAARNLPKVSSMQRDPYATANLLETISKDVISRVSNIESDNSQNVGLEDYNNISVGIFPHFTTPSIKIRLG